MTEEKVEEVEKVRYEWHSCKKCVFLGWYGKADLYWCPSHFGESRESLVRQVPEWRIYDMGGWKSRGTWSALLSGRGGFLPETLPYYRKAARLAVSQGLVCKGAVLRMLEERP